MARVPVVLLCMAVALVGCASKGGGERDAGPEDPIAGPDGFKEPPGDDADAEPEPERITLATQSSGVTMPGRYPASFEVPEGGVTNVAWTLTYQVIGPYEVAQVEGPGCAPEIHLSGSGTTFTWHGVCGNFAAGNATVDVVLDVPVHGYAMELSGLWTPPEASD